MIKLSEAIYGSLATVFHRSHTGDKSSFKIFVGKKRTGVAIFGGGFYTTYDIEDQLNARMIRNYGEYVFKVIAKVDHFFVMDGKSRQQAMNKYTAKQKEVIKQIEELAKDDEDFNQWDDDGYLIYIINKIPKIDDLIRENFDGIIYTSKDDGRCALIFNPSKSYTKVVAVAHVPDWNVDWRKIEWKKF
jgi:uncharacterized C2H2 Zn-finger protein